MTVVAGLALVVGGSRSTAAPRADFAAVALNILAPGQSGDLNLNRNSTDQLRLYDALTRVQTNLRDRDLRRYFKPAWFGLRGTRAVRTVRPRRGVRIIRDAWGVPHVEGRTDRDVAFGAGWATAEDRGLVLQLIRGPGRLAAIDAPGVDPLAVLGRQFTPTPATEAFLAGQTKLLLARGRKGRETLSGIDAYAAGINAYFRSKGIRDDPWTRNDTYAAISLIASQFGRGGGDEARRSEFLSALQIRLGAARGLDVFDDLRQQHGQSPVTVSGVFRYGRTPATRTGNVVLDAGSLDPLGSASPARRWSMSNALVVSAKKSWTGRPLFVSGPQVGFSYPAFFTELDLHGGGIDARGISFPGTFGVVIGRGKDFVWSAQSSHSDVIDQYVETLCGDDAHYVFRGSCREMGTFDAGTLGGTRIVFRTTVHGPVVGYATVGGRRVAISSKRSSRGREVLSSFAFQDLNRNRVRSARSFLRAMNQVDFAFNWVYADSRDIAFFSAGRLPIRPSGVDLGLPTDGTGAFEWRGFLSQKAHPHGVNPPSGAIVAWNNRPAPGYAASDDTWNWGSVHRVEMLRNGIAGRRVGLSGLVSVMNRAATRDLRAIRVFPVIFRIALRTPAPSARAEQMLRLVESWRFGGARRLDQNLDGKIDNPGAAILDAAWPKLADAVLKPVLGPLTDDLAKLERRDDAANSQGSAYDSGWYGYVERDLRALQGSQYGAPFRVRYCGAGDIAACSASLWAAFEAAGAELAAAQGPDPTQWRADATRERIRFSGGILSATMHFTNRPTFQQVMTFRKHR